MHHSDPSDGAMIEADERSSSSPDFPKGYDALHGEYPQRHRDQKASYYQALGVGREALGNGRL